MQIKTHTAFPQLDTKQSYHNKISVLSAVNKLKQIQHQLHQTTKRQIVLKRIQQARIAKEHENKKINEFKQFVRNSVNMQKKIKEQANIKRLKQIQKFHQMNLTFRDSHYEALYSVRSRHLSENHKIRSNIKQTSKMNESLIKQYKRRQLQQKQEKRMRISQNEQKRKQYIKQFRESRIMLIKNDRERDVNELEKKIQQRYRHINKLNNTMSKSMMMRSKYYQSNSSFNDNDERGDQDWKGKKVDGCGYEEQSKREGQIVNPENSPQNHNDQKITLSQKQPSEHKSQSIQQQSKSTQINPLPATPQLLSNNNQNDEHKAQQ